MLKKCTEQIGRVPVNKMLYIKQLRPRLNVQTDIIRDKVFGCVFTTAVVSLNIPEMVCLQTSLSDLKMIRVFMGKIQQGESACQCNNKNNKNSTTVVFPIWITASDSSLTESNCQLA